MITTPYNQLKPIHQQSTNTIMSKFTICLWPLVTLIILAITLFFNYTASTGLLSDKAVGDVADIYNVEIVPAGWTFSIWGFIYIWQFLWIIYVLVLCCKYKMENIIFGRTFYILYNIGNICNAAWIAVWVNEIIEAAAVFLVGITICLILSAFLAHKYMFIHIPFKSVQQERNNYNTMNNNNDELTNILITSKSIKYIIYGLVLNGIPFYATWCTVASHLNICITLVYSANMSDTAASILMLSVLTVVIFIYWSLDFGKTTKYYLRYTYSPYIVLIVAFSGILSKTNGINDDKPSSYFVCILLIIAVLGTIAKVIQGFVLKNKDWNHVQQIEV